jgi:glycosyltransferase involved in cell wall biosynthesis
MSNTSTPCQTKDLPNTQLISIIVPAFNEEEVILEFNRRLTAARSRLPFSSEVVFVNDGSRDRTIELLHELRAGDPSIAIVDLSRNFGKEIALTAGLDHARGDAVIVIDADLQDPPELIPLLVERWRDEGADVVYAVAMHAGLELPESHRRQLSHLMRHRFAPPAFLPTYLGWIGADVNGR